MSNNRQDQKDINDKPAKLAVIKNYFKHLLGVNEKVSWARDPNKVATHSSTQDPKTTTLMIIAIAACIFVPVLQLAMAGYNFFGSNSVNNDLALNPEFNKFFEEIKNITKHIQYINDNRTMSDAIKEEQMKKYTHKISELEDGMEKILVSMDAKERAMVSDKIDHTLNISKNVSDAPINYMVNNIVKVAKEEIIIDKRQQRPTRIWDIFKFLIYIITQCLIVVVTFALPVIVLNQKRIDDTEFTLPPVFENEHDVIVIGICIGLLCIKLLNSFLFEWDNNISWIMYIIYLLYHLVYLHPELFIEFKHTHKQLDANVVHIFFSVTMNPLVVIWIHNYNYFGILIWYLVTTLCLYFFFREVNKTCRDEHWHAMYSLERGGYLQEALGLFFYLLWYSGLLLHIRGFILTTIILMLILSMSLMTTYIHSKCEAIIKDISEEPLTQKIFQLGLWTKPHYMFRFLNAMFLSVMKFVELWFYNWDIGIISSFIYIFYHFIICFLDDETPHNNQNMDPVRLLWGFMKTILIYMINQIFWMVYEESTVNILSSSISFLMFLVFVLLLAYKSDIIPPQRQIGGLIVSIIYCSVYLVVLKLFYYNCDYGYSGNAVSVNLICVAICLAQILRLKHK